MKIFIRALLVSTMFAFTSLAHAALTVFACEPEWAALAQELGGEKVTAVSATTAMQDPHHIEARPSLIARLRQADLVVCTGAELEAGWLPILLRQAGNAKVQPDRPGYFDASQVVERLEIPQRVDRSMGDVHASGNPHVHTDPRRLATVANKLAERLATLDPANASHYTDRHRAFAQRWQKAIAEWNARAASLKGVRIVAHHRDWVYLYDWLGLVDAGTLEAKPGLPPSAGHLAELKRALLREPARVIVRTPFQDPRPSEWLAGETKIPAVVLPYTIGGAPEAQNLFTLFDVTITRLLETTR